jgi:hypothetical protein
MPVEDIVRDLNLFLRGWANYFRYGNSARVLGQIRNYALQRLAIWLSKKGNRRRAWRWGLKQLLLSPNHMGLISLDGTVVAPRPFRRMSRVPWNFGGGPLGDQAASSLVGVTAMVASRATRRAGRDR